MFDPQKLWPFGLSRSNWVAPIGLIALAFAVLVPFDAGVALWARLQHETIRGFFELITRAGRSDWYLVPCLIIAPLALALARLPALASSRDWLMNLFSVTAFMFMGTAIPGLLANIAKRIIGRARPVHLDEMGSLHFEPVSIDWTFQSFPSGDTTTIFAIAAIVTCLRPDLKIWAFTAAALVGVSRIMVGMHYPTDVLGGMLLGTITAYAVRNYWLSRNWLFEKNSGGNVLRK